MQRKTQTTLEELRIGDRFIYNPRRVDPWQVMARADKNGKVAVNQINHAGKPIHRHDELKKKTTPVVFLRHTVIQPQEECFLEDLNEGDIFCMKDNNVFEYIIQKKGNDFYDVRRLDQAAPFKGGKLATVIFIRKKEEVVK